MSTFTTPGTISGTKTYSGAGVYIVTVTVKQDNFPITHVDTKTFEYYVVVYDPNGGFVTGGGWINSPAGAYVRRTRRSTGKANFGFVSKYKKGQSTPDGNTEFQFQAGNMNFKSDGTTNGSWSPARRRSSRASARSTAAATTASCSPRSTATSKGSGADTFRMKIWNKNNGDAVVYDNQIGAPDRLHPTTTLGGGSIEIHDK